MMLRFSNLRYMDTNVFGEDDCVDILLYATWSEELIDQLGVREEVEAGEDPTFISVWIENGDLYGAFMQIDSQIGPIVRLNEEEKELVFNFIIKQKINCNCC